MAIYPKATSESNILDDDVGDAKSPPDFMNTDRSNDLWELGNNKRGSCLGSHLSPAFS